MSVQPADRSRRYVLIQSAVVQYAFAVGAFGVAFGLRLVLDPLIGRGAPFVLFLAATMVTGLVAGGGPALLCFAMSLPVSIAVFVVPDHTVAQTVLQASLYSATGLTVVYLTVRTTRHRRMLSETIELAPDAYLLADLDANFTDANQAACRLLGYDRAELLEKTIFDIIPPEDARRLKAVRTELMVPGTVHKAEWTLRRRDGTFVPVEASANILPDRRWQAFIRDISERKRTEDLRQVYSALLDNSSDFIGIADPTGKPIYVNPAGRRMVGLAPDFPVGRTQIQDFYPPQLRAFVTNVLLKTMVDHGQWSGETQFQNFQTHDEIPVSDTHFLIRDASGKRVLGLGTVTRDISDARRIAAEREELLAQEQLARHQAESAIAQLRESEERFRLTIDNAPIGMALVALDGHFVRVNQTLAEITGYTPDELTKLTFQDLTHPDDVNTDVELMKKLARGDIPRYQIEKCYVRKDQSIVDVVVNRAVLRGPDGGARYYITQIEDITARKRAEKALRLSEAKFSGIVSIAADAIISVDEDQRITLFNEGAEKVFGYAKEEMIGTALDRLIPERLRAIHREHVAHFGAAQEFARKVDEGRGIFGLRKNGEEFPAEASISKVTVGGATFFSVVMRDITRRKSREEALRRAIAERDDVLGIVAHDLRNPLSTIMMQAALLERPEPEPDRRDPTARLVITRSARRMNSLIQDLLDIAVVEAGQLKVARERLPAPELAREAVETQSSLASRSGLELHLDVGRGVGDVWGDRNRLLQVFDNLIGNAIKFTPEGGRITVSVALDHEELVFSVADTGRGIAPESVPHVFDRFWQAATRARRLGAGLGLPITKGIVEAHGGRIWVESTLERGSTFFFTIPVAPADAGPPAEPKLAATSTPTSEQRRARRQRTS